MKVQLTCSGCQTTVTTPQKPIYWTCTICGTWNETR